MNAIQRYFNYRQSLIDQYVKGDMTKKEYLEYNLDAVLSVGIKPFKNIDSVEKALFNYQYYNAHAKFMKSSADIANDYYAKKDRATQMVLKILDYRGVTAYFIHTRSKQLDGRLIEIIIKTDFNEMILHTANKWTLNRLREEGVFLEEKRESLIDGYINQKY